MKLSTQNLAIGDESPAGALSDGLLVEVGWEDLCSDWP